MTRFILLLIAAIPVKAHAGMLPANFTGTPVGSWAYYELENAGHGQSTSYFPTARAEFSDAIFQGFVSYNHEGNTTFYGTGNDTMQVFSTYIWADVDTSLAIEVTGDDGHALFVNGDFVAGGGFGAVLNHTLEFSAGVPIRLEVVGYNGPGNWVFGIATQEGRLLEQVEGLRTSAVVPEPSTLSLFGMGSLMLVSVFGRQRLPRKMHSA